MTDTRTATSARLARFAEGHGPLVKVAVREARGSTPREQGAWMLVAPESIFGTIGGGRLEFMAIDHARTMIAGDPAEPTLSVPLGPDIGQCCGGHVALAFEAVDKAGLEALARQAASEDRTQPHVFVFGAGHVGHALVRALAPLPLHCVLVETRAEALADVDDSTESHLTAVPESFVEDAPADAAFVILTHDHALDFLIARAALARDDAGYIGMIGSQTKRATFERWYRREAGGDPADCARLVLPIGGAHLRDKRPAVIAALTAAEILSALH